MKFKNGILMLGIRPEITAAFPVIDRVYANHGQEAVITSACGEKHGRWSRHYVGLAVDLRTRFFTKKIGTRLLIDRDKVKAVRIDLEKALGREYFIREEADHIHLSFKPNK